MIRKLRRRFIAIAMLSTALVLLLIVGIINIINYANVNQGIDQEMSMILDNGGTFPQFWNQNKQGGKSGSKSGQSDLPDLSNLPDLPDTGLPSNLQTTSTSSSSGNGSTGSNSSGDVDLDKRIAFEEQGMSKESPFDTRYFSVVVDADGNGTAVDTSNIYFLTEDDAVALAEAVYTKGKTSGKTNDFCYDSVTTDDGTLYAFIYYGKELSTFQDFLVASVGISAAGLLVVYILLLFFSKVVLRPVEESYAKQKRFITDASHELKTPLTVIDANTEILEMTEGENEWTESIKKQTKRLAKLTESLVLLSRMDEEQSIVEKVEFDLSQTVMDLAESYETVARTKGFAFHSDIQENVMYLGDEGRIGQLLGILLDNAMKYTSPGGEIRVSLKSEGNKKHLSVWNTVEEIEQGKHDQLFDRFYRMDQSRNAKTGGFGIGLSVARAIAEAHKGSIHAKSDDGASIVFDVIL